MQNTHNMPVETTAGAGIGLAAKYGLLAKLATMIASGALGALVIAGFNAKTKTEAFFRATVACICSLVFSTPAFGLLIYLAPFLKPASLEDALSLYLSVGFVIGSLSWGVVGILAELQRLMSESGATAIGEKLGVKKKRAPRRTSPTPRKGESS